MVTPSEAPDIVQKWLQFRAVRLKNGPGSLRQICLAIAEEYSCSPNTVRYHLDAEYRDRQRASTRNSQRRRRARRRRVQLYRRAWTQLTRNLERVLQRTFQTSAEVNLADITNSIRRQCGGIRFRSSTIERLLRKHIDLQRFGFADGPAYFVETSAGRFRYQTARPETSCSDPEDDDMRSDRYAILQRERDRARSYQRVYHRLIRSPERFLTKIFHQVVAADLNTITMAFRALPEAENVAFQSKTIRRVLDEYIVRGRGPPYLRYDAENMVWEQYGIACEDNIV